MVGGTLSSHLKEHKTALTLRSRYKLVSTSHVYLPYSGSQWTFQKKKSFRMLSMDYLTVGNRRFIGHDITNYSMAVHSQNVIHGDLTSVCMSRDL